MYEDLVDVFDVLEVGCATRHHLPRILNGWSAMHRTRCDCNGGARNTTYKIQPARTECVRSRSIAHSQNRAPARGDERDGVLSLRGHGQRRVVRDSATCVVRAIDGDRGGARDSSRLFTVCCVSPPLRSAFLQLMTLRSTSSNPYHFNFFSDRFLFPWPLSTTTSPVCRHEECLRSVTYLFCVTVYKRLATV